MKTEWSFLCFRRLYYETLAKLDGKIEMASFVEETSNGFWLWKYHFLLFAVNLATNTNEPIRSTASPVNESYILCVFSLIGRGMTPEAWLPPSTSDRQRAFHTFFVFIFAVSFGTKHRADIIYQTQTLTSLMSGMLIGLAEPQYIHRETSSSLELFGNRSSLAVHFVVSVGFQGGPSQRMRTDTPTVGFRCV